MPLAAGAHARHGAILGDLAANHQIGDLATFGQLLNGDVREVTPAGAATGERNNDGVLGILDQLPGGPGMALLPARLLPLGWRSERGGGFLNGGSEDGGLLELWLSLARRASNSCIRSSSCSICARNPRILARADARPRPPGSRQQTVVGSLLRHGANLRP